MHPPIQSAIYGVPQVNTFGNSLQSGFYHPMKKSNHKPQQPSNYQLLVNEHSNFNRPISSSLNMLQAQ
jgi:hypothetical protein